MNGQQTFKDWSANKNTCNSQPMREKAFRRSTMKKTELWQTKKNEHNFFYKNDKKMFERSQRLFIHMVESHQLGAHYELHYPPDLRWI